MRTDLVDGDNVLVFESGGRLGLPQKTLGTPRFCGGRRPHHLQSHAPLETAILRLKHDPHPAGAEHAEHAKFRDPSNFLRPFRRIEEIFEVGTGSLVQFAGDDRGPLKRAGFGILPDDRRTRAAFLDVVDDAFFVDVGQSAQQQPLQIVVARAMSWWTHANICGLHCRFSRTCRGPLALNGPAP